MLDDGVVANAGVGVLRVRDLVEEAAGVGVGVGGVLDLEVGMLNRTLV